MARKRTTMTVIRTERVGPHIVRVVLGDPGFDDFTPNEFTDAYVKLLFDRPEGEVMRTYTVRSVDAAAREVAIDIVVHGDEGIAGPWAVSVQPGERIEMYGPSGAYAPRADADWHLLAGDESALPAIATALEALPEGAPAKVFIEVAAAADELALTTKALVEVTWVHRGGAAHEVGEDRAGDNAPLVAAVRNAAWLPGQVGVFIHGEAQTVMHNLRPYIRKERGVPAEFASISGYWRRGRTEEGFRAWKKELAAAESGGRA